MSIKVKTYDNIKIKYYSVAFNPVGKDYYIIPSTQYKNGYLTTVSAINGEFRTSNWFVKGVAFDGTNLMIVLNQPVSVPIRINYGVIEQL